MPFSSGKLPPAKCFEAGSKTQPDSECCATDRRHFWTRASLLTSAELMISSRASGLRTASSAVRPSPRLVGPSASHDRVLGARHISLVGKRVALV